MSFQTAWLKHYYPKHFYAALLTIEGDDQSSVASLIAEAKSLDIPILPPDINISGDDFSPVAEGIRYRLTTIKHVGGSAINEIYKLRPIKNLTDLLMRSERRFLKSNVITSLIKSGSFDVENENRFELLNLFQRMRSQDVEDYPEYKLTDKLEMEKDSLGMYLTSHPLERYHYDNFSELKEGERGFFGGEVLEVKVVRDKKGNEMAFIDIGNQYGATSCIAFSSLWKKKQQKDLVIEGAFLQILGTMSKGSCLIQEMKGLEI